MMFSAVSISLAKMGGQGGQAKAVRGFTETDAIPFAYIEFGENGLWQRNGEGVVDFVDFLGFS